MHHHREIQIRRNGAENHHEPTAVRLDRCCTVASADNRCSRFLMVTHCCRFTAQSLVWSAAPSAAQLTNPSLVALVAARYQLEQLCVLRRKFDTAVETTTRDAIETRFAAFWCASNREREASLTRTTCVAAQFNSAILLHNDRIGPQRRVDTLVRAATTTK